MNTTGVHVRGKKPFSSKQWAGAGLGNLCIDNDKALNKYLPFRALGTCLNAQRTCYLDLVVTQCTPH
eukprot:COSAG01_NODE_9371_length_2464_cov_57.103594_4_plen_67_part_00